MRSTAGISGVMNNIDEEVPVGKKDIRKEIEQPNPFSFGACQDSFYL